MQMQAMRTEILPEAVIDVLKSSLASENIASEASVDGKRLGLFSALNTALVGYYEKEEKALC